MEMTKEALALADYLDNNVEAMLFTEQPYLDKAPAMIRRLVAELDNQGSSIWDSFRRVRENCQCDGCRSKTAPQTKPLSAERIEELREYHGINDWLYETSVIDFARAIEKEHGIKPAEDIEKLNQRKTK